MCVLALAWRAHPRWELVLAGNRDELHARPAAPLARWDGSPQILAGRDLEAGGTWLGVSETGRLSVVTNLRGYGLPERGRASRGALVADLLAGEDMFADAGAADLARFNPFNLVHVERGRARFLTNRPAAICIDLEPGIYGLSNGTLDAPWPKTLHLKSRMLDWLVDGAEDPQELFAALADGRLPAAGLPPAEPSDVPEEALLSPVFIRGDAYGTRCSTVVAIAAEGKGMIAERRFDAAGDAIGDTALGFDWPR